jgi:ribose 5-phosphate isomerase B
MKKPGNIAVAADHGGAELKELLCSYLRDKGCKVSDFGIAPGETSDYPDTAMGVIRAVLSGDSDAGILICGTGIGMSIVANRFEGIRAALCNSEFAARMSRAHNNANVLAMGGRIIGNELAKAIVDVWLATPFEGGRHERRINKIEAMAGSIKNGDINAL